VNVTGGRQGSGILMLICFPLGDKDHCFSKVELVKEQNFGDKALIQLELSL
jgi:hypothetical protein